ncbi:MAG: iron-containing redox enzyme family protein [Pseudolabrys sp.]
MNRFSTPSGIIATLSADEVHRRLASFNTKRFAPALPESNWRDDLCAFVDGATLEGEFLEGECERVRARASRVPVDPDGFVAWFEELQQTGPGQNDPLFPWLAKSASMAEMKWFLTQEIAGEAGFEDLTALTQVRFPTRPKLELARNYWDEMGRGKPKGMHGPLLEHLAVSLGLETRVETTVWESLALANTMAGLAASRRYAYHSIGALGVIELTAPGRAIAVATGLKRLGVPAGDRHYFDLHSILDVKHSFAWNAEAIHPLVAENPKVALAIAEGALMRLECGRRCFDRYRRELGVQPELRPEAALSG